MYGRHMSPNLKPGSPYAPDSSKSSRLHECLNLVWNLNYPEPGPDPGPFLEVVPHISCNGGGREGQLVGGKGRGGRTSDTALPLEKQSDARLDLDVPSSFGQKDLLYIAPTTP